MKAIRLFSAGLLLLTLGFAAPAHSRQQDDKNKQAPPARQEPPRQEAPRQEPPKQAPPAQHPTQQPRQQPPPKEQPRQQPTQQPRQAPAPKEQPRQQPTKAPTQHSAPPHSTPQQAYGGAYHGGVKSTAPTNGGVHPSGVPQHSGQVRSGFAQSKAGNWNSDHKTWQQRGGYNGYRIPDARFSMYFGTGHHFRIGGLPILFVGGYPRFQYDGYWITFVDPWPDNWNPDWYETDDVYLEYTDDGYYLYDSNYPAIGIAVTVSM
jgi:hypothetical protein